MTEQDKPKSPIPEHSAFFQQWRAEVEGRKVTGADLDRLQKGLTTPVDEGVDNTRRKLIKGIGAAGTLLALAGIGGFAAKQAVDAAGETARDVVKREFQERSDEMLEFLDQSVATADKLGKAMMDFLIELAKDSLSWDRAGRLAVRVMDGLGRDIFSGIETRGRDLSPDSLLEEVRGHIRENPKLSRKWDEIEGYVTELQALPMALDELKESVTGFDEEDKAQAWEDYKRNYKREVQEAFNSKQ